ncbi:hypothetical protein J8281_05985 [Aquimarina sp. U1-2]|uniref:hypothetical protein n=1 Tax=Aquimarina sp. U1-2 TaxID=2823141 RepID=UPI001AECF76F|nr:hypothetical protein [Aquimarina sp. U1-2]MBP2831734.1 hypothetical protein [Aquimarina sp. U1-2]
MKFFLVLSIAILTCSFSFSQHTYFTTQKCKNTTNDRIRRDCIIKEIQSFVDEHYNIATIASDAKPGKNRVYTRFKIGRDGKITDIQTKSTAFSLEVEAIRVLQSFPVLIPSSKKSLTANPQDVFTLPIVFTVDKTDVEIENNEKLTGNE